MNIGQAAGFSRPQSGRQCLISLLSSALLFATGPQNLWGYQDAQAPAQAGQGPTYTPQTPEQLQQLVVPIALYPDSLVAQILAASTFPTQVVEADRWLQANPDLKGEALAQAVDQQPWDPSVKALTAFPSVLGNMDKNLSLDVISGRRLLQPGTGCNGCRTGDAPAGANSRQSEDHVAASRNDARPNDHR
jgi:Protein of unknown function (DUF3300)